MFTINIKAKNASFARCLSGDRQDTTGLRNGESDTTYRKKPGLHPFVARLVLGVHLEVYARAYTDDIKLLLFKVQG
jgi:hypothetical protein